MRGIRPVIAAVACTIASFALGPAASARPQPGRLGAASAQFHRADQGPARDQHTHPTSGRAIPLGSSPQIVRIDRRTRTAYVTSDQGTISVIDIARCNAARRSGCARPVATLPGKGGGADLAVDDRTQTLYVASSVFDASVNDANGIVSVFDVAHCYAADTAGCGAAIATVPVGDVPLGLALNRSTGTLYVGNVANRVDVLDVQSCRRGQVSGCAHARLGSVHGNNPGLVVLDAAHNTLYVTENGQNEDGRTVLVIDTRHCRASDRSGCGAPAAHLPTGAGPTLALLARATHTLYTANQGDNTVSVLDVAHCTGADHTGCRQTPTNVPVGANPSGGLIKTTDDGLYVGNTDSDTLSNFDTQSCRAGHTSGCPTSPPRTLRTGQQPFWAEYDRASDTIFVTDHVDGTLEVVDPDRCGTEHRRGCRRLLPTISGPSQRLADNAVHTWYGQDEAGNLTLTDTRVCTAQHARRCPGAAIHTAQRANLLVPVVDDSTHSLFVPSYDPATGKNYIAVLDTQTCNATVHTDCSPVTAPMRLPMFIAEIAINKRTHTVYAGIQVMPNELVVIDGMHCNAIRQTACSAPVGKVPLDDVIFAVTTNEVTNSVYVTEFGANFDKSTVFIVDGRHCQATDVSGCSRAPKRFTSGLAPLGVVVDNPVHSFYVLDNAGGDASGDITVFDTRTCNAVVTSGCAHPAARFMVGRAPFLAALEPVTQHVYVGDFVHAALTEIDARTCNATHPRGCRDHELDIGDLPRELAIDAVTHSLFVTEPLYGRSAYLDTRRDPGH